MKKHEKMNLSEDQSILLLVNKDESYAGLFIFAKGEQNNFAFTSEEKAKDFLRKMRADPDFPRINKLFPCTIGEYLSWQETRNYPPLRINMDADELLRFPHKVGPMSKYNFEYLSIDDTNGKIKSWILKRTTRKLTPEN